MHCFKHPDAIHHTQILPLVLSAARMPAYTGIPQMYLLPATTVHVMQPLLTAATVCYVIRMLLTFLCFQCLPNVLFRDTNLILI